MHLRSHYDNQVRFIPINGNVINYDTPCHVRGYYVRMNEESRWFTVSEEAIDNVIRKAETTPAIGRGTSVKFVRCDDPMQLPLVTLASHFRTTNFIPLNLDDNNTLYQTDLNGMCLIDCLRLLFDDDFPTIPFPSVTPILITTIALKIQHSA